jgi:transcription elongation factor Elf1
MVKKDRETKIMLFCINCNKESTHTVHYIGNYLRSVVCDNCNKKIEIDRRHLRTVFAEDFINRILTKPHRMTEDMKKALATLTPFFPKRLFKEPLKVIREIYAVLKKENGNGENKESK